MPGKLQRESGAQHPASGRGFEGGVHGAVTISRHGKELAELSLDNKQKIAPLFMPGLHRREMTELWNAHSLVAELCTYVRQHSSFWPSAFGTPEFSDGELFFELLSDTDIYRLEVI